MSCRAPEKRRENEQPEWLRRHARAIATLARDAGVRAAPRSRTSDDGARRTRRDAFPPAGVVRERTAQRYEADGANARRLRRRADLSAANGGRGNALDDVCNRYSHVAA